MHELLKSVNPPSMRAVCRLRKDSRLNGVFLFPARYILYHQEGAESYIRTAWLRCESMKNLFQIIGSLLAAPHPPQLPHISSGQLRKQRLHVTTEPKPALNWTSFLSPSVCPMPLPSGLLTPDPVSPNSQQTYPTVHSSFSITTFHKIHLLGFQGPCHALLEHGDTRLSSIPPFSPQPQSLQF